MFSIWKTTSAIKLMNPVIKARNTAMIWMTIAFELKLVPCKCLLILKSAAKRNPANKYIPPALEYLQIFE
jgi:hypothetical protein